MLLEYLSETRTMQPRPKKSFMIVPDTDAYKESPNPMIVLSTEPPVTFPAAHAGVTASVSSDATTSIRPLNVMTSPRAIRPQTRDCARSKIARHTLYDLFLSIQPYSHSRRRSVGLTPSFRKTSRIQRDSAACPNGGGG